MGREGTGALPPAQAAEDTYEDGLHKLSQSAQLTFVKNVAGALLLSFGGLLALTVSAGSPSLAASNPGIVKLLQGVTFPIGLVFIYFTGAEL